MIFTQLEGKVTSEQWDTLKQAFHAGIQPLPSAIYQTYLIQDQTESEVWRIITIWRSYEALQDYRASIETPEGIIMFRAAGTEPTLSISEVMDYSHQD